MFTVTVLVLVLLLVIEFNINIFLVLVIIKKKERRKKFFCLLDFLYYFTIFTREGQSVTTLIIIFTVYDGRL